MNRKLVFALPFLLLSLMGCSKGSTTPFRLSYSRYMYEGMSSSLNKITYQDLYKMMNIEDGAKGENFILAIYFYEAGAPSCGCWADFKKALEKYIANTGYEVYSITSQDFIGLDKMGLQVAEKDGSPTLALIESGKIRKQFIYSSKNKMFSDAAVLEETLSEYIVEPNLIKINQEQLDTKLFIDRESLNIQYIWSTCSDCAYCYSHIMYENAHSKKFNEKLYVIDVDNLTYINGIRDTTNETYRTFLADHHLSEDGDSTFGYSMDGPGYRGFVPSIQHWINGELKDMNVYLNDKVELVGDEYQVTHSYYSSERVTNLSHAQDVENNVLVGLKVQEKDVNETSWAKDAANVYHAPLLLAFLEDYVF